MTATAMIEMMVEEEEGGGLPEGVREASNVSSPGMSRALTFSKACHRESKCDRG